MSHEIAAMSFSRNHSRHEMCMPGCGDTRGTQSGAPAKALVAVAHDHHVARLHLHAGAGGDRVELLGRDGLADRHEAFLATGRDVQQDASRGETVEVRVDRAPGGAGGGEAVLERPAVEQLAVPATWQRASMWVIEKP
jgi:hypothetical protein